MKNKDFSFKKLLKSLISNTNKNKYQEKTKKIGKFLEKKKLLSITKETKRIFDTPFLEYLIYKYGVEFSKNSIMSKNYKKKDAAAAFRSLPMRSTILLFYLFKQYGLNLIYQQNSLPQHSIAISNSLLTRKLILLDNYLYCTQLFYKHFNRSAFKKKALYPNSLFSSRSSLQQNNIFFSSCSLRSPTILFYKKNIPTKYFFNYQNYFESIISSFYKNRIDLNLIKISGFYKNAQYIVDEIVYFLERRVPYNKIKARFQKELCSKRVFSSLKGIRISYSGRLGGKTNKAERKKIDTWSFGQTSFHILSSNLDFAAGQAETKFGIAGVKVWIASEISYL